MCIGLPLAITEMKMFIARMFSTYATEFSPEWFLEDRKVRPEEDRGELWSSKNKPWKKHEPILFQRL